MYTIRFINPLLQFGKYNWEVLVLRGGEIIHRRHVKLNPNVTNNQLRTRATALLREWLEENGFNPEDPIEVIIDRPQ